MDETIRYRIIGAVVIVCFIAILSPIVLKQRAIVVAENKKVPFYHPVDAVSDDVAENEPTEWEKPLSVARVSLDKRESTLSSLDKVEFEPVDNTERKAITSLNNEAQEGVQTTEPLIVDNSSKEPTLTQLAEQKKVRPVAKKEPKTAPSAIKQKPIKRVKMVTTAPQRKKVVKSSQVYTVRLAAFKDNNNALKLQKNLQKLGHSTFMRSKITHDRQKITFVFVGELNNKDEATNLQKKLLAKTQLKGMVVRKWSS